jgi:hypothetical protein
VISLSVGGGRINSPRTSSHGSLSTVDIAVAWQTDGTCCFALQGRSVLSFTDC